MTAPFIGLGLKACELMNIQDSQSQKMIFRFCKIYPAEKIVRIVEHAKKYPWWEKNPKAAFMKAVGEINRAEKA